jgi:2-oxo-4-hydroxy-4-carboxy-5-ureidoimidazoline decarboxylase
MEAFRSHPRIGESSIAQPGKERSSSWSSREQAGVMSETDATRIALAKANREYEERFGQIFLVCASGKSGTEILGILRRRLQNNAEEELLEAVEQQRQITQIRLKRWLGE